MVLLSPTLFLATALNETVTVISYHFLPLIIVGVIFRIEKLCTAKVHWFHYVISAPQQISVGQLIKHFHKAGEWHQKTLAYEHCRVLIII